MRPSLNSITSKLLALGCRIQFLNFFPKGDGIFGLFGSDG